mmetsp:Transcript_27137/g.79023  ORF Transcript_27137/g.79023 Transcript_27137/m.79023 type:complete len:127 (-) Transcript_27137:13-393(-)
MRTIVLRFRRGPRPLIETHISLQVGKQLRPRLGQNDPREPEVVVSYKARNPSATSPQLQDQTVAIFATTCKLPALVHEPLPEGQRSVPALPPAADTFGTANSVGHHGEALLPEAEVEDLEHAEFLP